MKNWIAATFFTLIASSSLAGVGDSVGGSKTMDFQLPANNVFICKSPRSSFTILQTALGYKMEGQFDERTLIDKLNITIQGSVLIVSTEIERSQLIVDLASEQMSARWYVDNLIVDQELLCESKKQESAE